jgi:oligopeptidase B
MSMLPPVAARKPHSTTHHGVTLEDPYAWLRDPGYPEVTDPEILAHLEAENRYFEAAMAPHAKLTQTLFEELKGRIKDDDASVPQRDGDWVYQWHFAPGAQYRSWQRKPASGGDWMTILDEPALAQGLDYFQLGMMQISPDGRLMAYATDTNGSERYTIRIRDLASGTDLPDAIEGTLGDIVWQADSSAFAYTPVNDQWRTHEVRLHRLGSSDDPLLYQEPDEGFRVAVGRTQSRAFAILAAGDNVTSEVRLVPLANLAATPLLVRARTSGVQYDVDERLGTLYILTNDTHVNFRIVTAPVSAPGDWQELIAGSADVYLRGLTSFRDQLIITERVRGLDQVRVRGYDGSEHRIAFPEAAYVASPAGNPEFALDKLRLSYESMVTPRTVFDYDLASRTLETLKVQAIPSGYDASLYATERLFAPGRDGTPVPLSIVYRKDRGRTAGPLHLYAYGAYGYAVPPGFSTARLSLLDRGIAFAIAHIRGGDDLGYQWYLDGKLMQRANTYNDFVDVARYLVAEGFANTGGISASGGSAGGLLMGAVVNQDPSLWRAIVAHVPFVDMINTMTDASLPLTPGEWPEWGNPISDKAAFDYILSYSPYENVRPANYPPMLITGGLNDPRVTYWEPAKWAAKLRATTTGDNLLLLKINMGAGHGGKSGRFDSLHEVAEEYTFLAMAFGLV